MEFEREHLLCHLLDTRESIENQPPMELTHYYTRETDVFEVSFKLQFQS